MRIYIAGPMSGLPEYNYPAFFAAEKALTEAGYEVANPANIDKPNDNPSWLDWMRPALTMMLTCDGVCLLPGWRESRGAEVENDLARSLKLHVAELSRWWQEAEEILERGVLPDDTLPF